VRRLGFCLTVPVWCGGMIGVGWFEAAVAFYPSCPAWSIELSLSGGGERRIERSGSADP